MFYFTLRNGNSFDTALVGQYGVSLHLNGKEVAHTKCEFTDADGKILFACPHNPENLMGWNILDPQFNHQKFKTRLVFLYHAWQEMWECCKALPAKATCSTPTITRDQIAKILQDLPDAQTQIRQDVRATPDYWNGDAWGSITGVRDAAAWIEWAMVDFVAKRLGITT